MRLDALFDSFYVAGSLWGGLTGSQVCPTIPERRPITPEIVRVSGAEVVAFVNVNVVPMDRERVLPNHTVLVEGERITALGPAPQIQVPAGAVRVDGRGKYLIPGFVDMHMHDLTKSQEQYHQKATSLFIRLASGFTGIRNLNTAPADLVQLTRHSQHFS